MSRTPVLNDAMWARIGPLLPPQKGPMGPPFRPHRPIVEGVLYRVRTGIPWRDLPAEYRACQTVHRRHQKWSEDGTWDRVLAQLQTDGRRGYPLAGLSSRHVQRDGRPRT